MARISRQLLARAREKRHHRRAVTCELRPDLEVHFDPRPNGGALIIDHRVARTVKLGGPEAAALRAAIEDLRPLPPPLASELRTLALTGRPSRRRLERMRRVR